jgi:acyl-CoA reductase-like NAD-dependent aldehyde dehydrogenase
VELMMEASLPAGALNVVYGGADLGAALVADPRVDFISFTGSSCAGASIKAASGLRRVALELGGNNATIVHEDADLAPAAAACARNAMRLAGQSCVSVQSVYVHERVSDAFLGLIEAEVRKVKLGDPLDPATEVGTLIDEGAARRVEGWVLRVGGVIVNGTSTWRTDQLAYGGVKASGMGREGPRYAIEEMTDQRLVVFNL